MDEYISKQAFKDKYLCCGYLPEMSETEFDTFPAADVVEVVRCRECKRWDPDPDSYGKDDGPKGKCMKSFEETYDDDFCSYGQRKEDAHVRDN